jgi:hypothetical protein
MLTTIMFMLSRRTPALSTGIPVFTWVWAWAWGSVLVTAGEVPGTIHGIHHFILHTMDIIPRITVIRHIAAPVMDIRRVTVPVIRQMIIITVRDKV